ncbi:MAG TPA: hypothetical protein VI911_04185 [Patescibacteria group bacterium]|nr:hypothetical protein [Patescibacteria group bacterium]
MLFTQMHVLLVGHRNLGIVQAAWDGPYLLLEDGTRYGPSAIFSVRPAEPEPEPEPLAGPLRGYEILLKDGTSATVTEVRGDVILLSTGRFLRRWDWKADNVTITDDNVPF